MPACLPAPAWRAARIAIAGDAGERAGGILVGETLGMRGGLLTIGGNAGPMLGERMRRGLVIVNGDAGDYAGGAHDRRHHPDQARVGRFAGYGLRRGSLILARGAEGPAADLRRLRRDRIQLSPAARALASRDSARPISLGDRARRLMGDMAVLGKGEMLILA